MTAKKLSDIDKDEIIQLYRSPEETTASLAQRYGVSSSTICRFLKSHLSESEYVSLTQQKQKRHIRSNRTVQAKASLPEPVELQGSDRPKKEIPKISLRQPPQESIREPLEPESLKEQEEFIEKSESGDDQVSFITVETILGEDIGDYEEDEEEEDEDEEEEEEDEDEEPDDRKLIDFRGIQVLPLSEASFPHTCYLVIDRASELITRPLKDFDHLGTIPSDEFQQKTLPVFDNHRVARRFSNRRGKVIKVPDGKMLRKTSSYLQSKGITRLLMDGQVYSLV
jgi:transposase-like protein